MDDDVDNILSHERRGPNPKRQYWYHISEAFCPKNVAGRYVSPSSPQNRLWMFTARVSTMKLVRGGTRNSPTRRAVGTD